MRGHAGTHFASGFIGESDGEYGERGNFVSGDNVRDAMSDDARFAAAGAGEDQEGSFGGGDCFTLWGIEAGEKIHLNSIFAGGVPACAPLHC